MQVIKAEVRDAILDSARKEFAQKGYSASSVRTIAANARTSAGNLYKYYAGKEELFLALVLPVTDECIGMVGRTFDIGGAGLETTPAHMADYVFRNRDIFSILMSGPSEHYSAFLSRFEECVSVKLREYAAAAAPGTVGRIKNPAFFDAVAAGYVGGLRPIIENSSDLETTRAYIAELMKFMFEGFLQRLPAAEPAER